MKDQSENLFDFCSVVDESILTKLKQNHEQILMIPSDSYERLMVRLEQEEEYELCSKLLSLKSKVSNLTVSEFLTMYSRMQTSVLMAQLSYILEALNKHKKNHD
jgi:PHD/YefM family antitoxin component YafN of YafNO toxin-antitoxin module